MNERSLDNDRRRGTDGAAKRQRELRERLRDRGSTGPEAKPGGANTITKRDEPTERDNADEVSRRLGWDK